MVNFQALIKRMIKRYRWTEQEIADYCGTVQSNISRLKRTDGSEPRWRVGNALIELSAMCDRNEK